ncbi:hypothetical protein BH09ACT1_BH09ACT1_20720 [soil metagenome]
MIVPDNVATVSSLAVYSRRLAITVVIVRVIALIVLVVAVVVSGIFIARWADARHDADRAEKAVAIQVERVAAERESLGAALKSINVVKAARASEQISVALATEGKARVTAAIAEAKSETRGVIALLIGLVSLVVVLLTGGTAFVVSLLLRQARTVLGVLETAVQTVTTPR